MLLMLPWLDVQNHSSEFGKFRLNQLAKVGWLTMGVWCADAGMGP